MIYRLFFEDPHFHQIRIRAEHEVSDTRPVSFSLSLWRPGRYEPANYPENVSNVSATSAGGDPLPLRKTDSHTWEVSPRSPGTVIFEYCYYANELNAGSSYFDAGLVYVNGVNLFVFNEQSLRAPQTVHLHLPENYRIACGLRQKGHTLFAGDFHQLVDSPFFASANLTQKTYFAGGIPFHLWFQGECRPDWEKLENDFSRFTQSQLDLFGSFPAKEYHWLFLILNQTYYHGVEHANSTVIALGPGWKLMEEVYEDLLGVSSHELFHTWNVKAIRPADMLPYDYRRPNYSRLHYVTEGITTYYGDLMLYKSGVWDLEKFIQNFNKSNLTRHYNNGGWEHVSLEEASFDSWVNGYKKGVPNRKISFYTKGCLVAMILDHRIRKASGNLRSLDDLMRRLYHRFGKTGTGYTREDVRGIAEELAGESMDDFFRDYISGLADITPALREAGEYFGLELEEVPFKNKSIYHWGLFVRSEKGKTFVLSLQPGSPAYPSGMSLDDELIAVNGIRVDDNFNELVEYLANENTLKITYFHLNELRETTLSREEGQRMNLMHFKVAEEPTEVQLSNREAWRQAKSQAQPA